MITYAYISGYSKYRFTSNGYVESFKKKRGVWVRMNGTMYDDGYIKVTLTDDNGTNKPMRLHVLICTAFHGDRPHGLEACHNDNNKSNNTSDNLRWDTHSSNMFDCVAAGNSQGFIAGSLHSNARLNEESVRTIRSMYTQGFTQFDLAKQFNVNPNTIGDIVRLRTWKHVV